MSHGLGIILPKTSTLITTSESLMQAMAGHQRRRRGGDMPDVDQAGTGLVHQPHLSYGGMQGIEQQAAGLGHHHRMQHQDELLPGQQEIATKRGPGQAIGDG